MKIICIEGLDGTGKNTLAKYIQKRLTEMGYVTKLASAPFYHTMSGNIVSSYLHGDFGDFTKMAPMRASTMYINDRIANKSEYDVSNCDYLILDRHYFSNIMFQGCKLDTNIMESNNIHDLSITSFISLMNLWELEYLGDIVSLDLKSHIDDMKVFVLKLDNASREAQISSRNNLDQNESNTEYLQRVNDFTLKYLDIFTSDFRKDLKIPIERRCRMMNHAIDQIVNFADTLKYNSRGKMDAFNRFFEAHCNVYPAFNERTLYLINILAHNPDFKYHADDFYKLFSENIIAVETKHGNSEEELQMICENNFQTIMGHLTDCD